MCFGENIENFNSNLYYISQSCSCSASHVFSSFCQNFYAPATKWGGAYSFALVCMSVCKYIHKYVTLCSTILSRKLLLQYLMQIIETYNTVLTYIEHVHKGNGILIQVIIAELCPL